MLLTALVLVASLSLAFSSPLQQKSSTVPKTAARLTQSQVDAIIKKATDEGSEYSFIPETDFGDEGGRLYVNTSRALIAFRAAKAGSNARIAVSPLERLDQVVVTCGNEDLGSRFDCIKVRVLLEGRPVPPLVYRPSTNSYRNALGARWQAREVLATYPFDRLSLGFSVEYTGDDGTVWTFRVSQEAMQRLRVIPD
jgi:hypothetical protein